MRSTGVNPDADRNRRARRSSGVRSTRRVRAILLAALMVAGTLSVVPPASAVARDATYDRIEGPTRYETAAETAEAYRDERGTGVDSVILVSGADEHFGYALIAPPLSRRYHAPMLLTEPDRLSVAASRFITRRSIDTVYIIGGTDAVSRRVQDDVDALRGVTVHRIGNNDVHATAAEVARRVGHQVGVPGNYRSEGRTVLVATSANFADGLAAGPLAYRGEHPILLTPSDSLHSAALDFMLVSDTQHAVILGGTKAISRDIERTLEHNEISSQRLAGANRFDTAAEIARELQGPDSPQSCFDGAEAGLANGWRPPDALVAAPLLGELCAPLLITDRDGLSNATEEILASDDYFTGDNDGDLRITVFGGTSAVSSTALSQADDAATLVPIIAHIEAIEGRCQIILTFNDPVHRADVESMSNYRLDGDRLAASDGRVDAGLGASTVRAVIILAGSSSPRADAQPVDCAEPLESGDRFEIIANSIGSASDNRVVRGESQRVAADRLRPQISFILLEGADFFYVESREPVFDNPDDDTDGTTAEVVYQRPGEDNIPLSLSFGRGETRVILPPPYAGGVKAGDSVRIAAGLLVDLAGNTNTAASRRAVSDNRAPRVSTVSLTAPVPRDAATVTFNGRGSGSRIPDAFTISGELTGAAAGADGNEWVLDLTLDPAWDAQRRTTMTVDAEQQLLTLVASQVRPLQSIANDLNANSSFAVLFEAEASRLARSTDATFSTGGTGLQFSGGTSSVDLVLTWSEVVNTCGETNGVDARQLGIDADADDEPEFYLDGLFAQSAGVTFVQEVEAGRRFSSDGAICDTVAGALPGTLVARLASGSIAALPGLRSQIFDSGGAATDLIGNKSVRRRYSNFTRPR